MKLKFLKLSLAFAFLFSILGASSCDTSDPIKDLDYIRVVWNDDASTAATVGWSYTDGQENQKIFYDEVDYGDQLQQYRYNQASDALTEHFGIKNAFARLKNLKPKTKYYFVIASSSTVSPRLYFETASDSAGDRLSIIVGGDSRNNRTPRKNANILVSKLRPHAVMFGGDMVDVGVEKLWREWFYDWQATISSDGRVTPIIITRGNHENENGILVDFFDTPEGVYYAVNINNGLLRVYTLNSESSISGNQTEWLKKDLESNSKVDWKFAQYHRPMRPHVKSKSEGDSQYKNWAELFYRHKVKVVVESDSHTVKSTWPLKPSSEKGNDEGFVRDDQDGTVYLGEGCWGAPLRTNDDNKSWTRDSDFFNHFNWIFVDRDRIEIRTVNVDNAPEVGTLSDESRYDLPANINIWKPNNGDLITITK